MSYAAAAAALAKVNAQIVPAAAGMSDLLGGQTSDPTDDGDGTYNGKREKEQSETNEHG